MFSFQPGAVSPTRHAPLVMRRTSILLIACSASLLAGACAHISADTPALQWQLNMADDGPANGAFDAAAVPAASSCGHVYREDRDPRPGLAYSQL